MTINKAGVSAGCALAAALILTACGGNSEPTAPETIGPVRPSPMYSSNGYLNAPNGVSTFVADVEGYGKVPCIYFDGGNDGGMHCKWPDKKEEK